MCTMKRKDDFILIFTPYSAEFVSDLKSRLSYRKWEADSKAWKVKAEDEDVVKQLLLNHFGYREDNTSTVTVIITAKEDFSEWHDSVRFCNIPVARATGRDSGAKVCDKVTMISGSINSGGSVKNWTTRIDEGSTFKLTSFPETALSLNKSEEWEYIIVEEKTAKEKLMEEKEKLLKRLEEIENELNL